MWPWSRARESEPSQTEEWQKIVEEAMDLVFEIEKAYEGALQELDKSPVFSIPYEVENVDMSARGVDNTDRVRESLIPTDLHFTENIHACGKFHDENLSLWSQFSSTAKVHRANKSSKKLCAKFVFAYVNQTQVMLRMELSDFKKETTIDQNVQSNVSEQNDSSGETSFDDDAFDTGPIKLKQVIQPVSGGWSDDDSDWSD